MLYYLNVKTLQLVPHVKSWFIDFRPYVSENTILISEEDAKLIAHKKGAERRAIADKIVREKFERHEEIPVGVKQRLDEIYEQRLRENARRAAEEPAKPVAPAANIDFSNGEPVTLKVTGNTDDRMTKNQIAKLSQANLVKYARNVLMMECADNEPYKELKERVYAEQFGDKPKAEKAD